MERQRITDVLILMRDRANEGLTKAKAHQTLVRGQALDTHIERLASEVFTLNIVIEMLTDDKFAEEIARCCQDD